MVPRSVIPHPKSPFFQYCLTDKPEVRAFDPSKTSATEYPITKYQPVYYLAESFQDAKEKLV